MGLSAQPHCSFQHLCAPRARWEGTDFAHQIASRVLPQLFQICHSPHLDHASSRLFLFSLEQEQVHWLEVWLSQEQWTIYWHHERQKVSLRLFCSTEGYQGKGNPPCLWRPKSTSICSGQQNDTVQQDCKHLLSMQIAAQRWSWQIMTIKGFSS